MNSEQTEKSRPSMSHDYKSNRERAINFLNKLKEIEYSLAAENKLQTHIVNGLTIQSLHSEKDSPMCIYVKDPSVYGYQ